MSGTTLLAHGVGGSTDLPLPLSYALIGCVWALIATFAVVAVAWRTPQLRSRQARAGATAVGERRGGLYRGAGVLAAAALAATAWVAVAAIWGPQDSDNALPGAFYVLLWVGLGAVSVLLGPIWRVISPVRTLWRLTHRRPGGRGGATTDARRRYPAGLGYWPAAAGLFGVRLVKVGPAGSRLADRHQGLDSLLRPGHVRRRGGVRAQVVRPRRPFEVYSVTVSRLSPFRRNRQTGRIVVGNPSTTCRPCRCARAPSR